MAWRIVALCLLLLCGTSACGHQAAAPVPNKVRTVDIGETVTPLELIVTPGEEVRWSNRRDKAVRLGFLSVSLLNDVACEHGVKTLFGTIQDLITIPPGGSISLCFVRNGELKYNVWFDAENPRGAMSPTGTIHVGRI